MKRILAFLIVLPMLLATAAVPMQFVAKSTAVCAPDWVRVGVRRNEAKTLYVEWSLPFYDDGAVPDGYQVFRSASGKSGSYQKVKTTKQTGFIDTGLKNGTIYYYKVRGYVKHGDQVFYSKFVKASGCTKLTNKQATKLLQNAYQVAGMWMDLAQPNCDRNKYLTKTHTESFEDGSSYQVTNYYYLVTNQTCQTKKQLKSYLGKTFDQRQVNKFVNRVYLEEDGKLWMFGPDWGDGAGPFADRDKVIYVSQLDEWLTFVNICNWGNDEDLFCDPVIHTAELRNGKWILTDKNWFQYSHFINF